MEDTYHTLAAPSTGSFKDRGSKFLSYAFPIYTEAEGQTRLAEVRKAHLKARHHCYAYRLGLADHLADDTAALEAYADGVAASVRKAAPGAIAATKALCRAAPNLNPDAMTEEAARVFAETLMSEEGREGIAAFAQKRQPKWAQS